MSSLIERVKAHYKADELRHVDIPEWGEGGEPLKAAFYPATMRDVSMAMKAADNDPSRYNARLVALKLLDDAHAEASAILEPKAPKRRG